MVRKLHRLKGYSNCHKCAENNTKNKGGKGMFSPLKNQKGFTLIELVIIIILIGVLAAVAVPRYVDLRENAVMASAQATLDGGRAGIMLDFSDKVLTSGTYADIFVASTAPIAITDASDLATLEGFMQSTPSYPPSGNYNSGPGVGFRWYVTVDANQPAGSLSPPVMDGLIDVSCPTAGDYLTGPNNDCYVSRL